MNTNSIETIILELDQISDLYSEDLRIYSDLVDLKSKKVAEVEKVEKTRQIIFESLIKFKEEQLKQVPKFDVFSSHDSISYPYHWFYETSKPDLKLEKELEEFSSPEKKEQFYNAFREYEKSFVKIMNACEEKGKFERQAYLAKLDAINSQYKKKEEELQAKREALKTEMNKHTVISSDLFYIAEEISCILKQKRADTLKEAINLALDEYRKEQEHLERQLHDMRMERLAEEDALAVREHNAAMERLAEEEARAAREHNEAMERAAQEHNAAMERAAQAQASAAKAQAREARWQTQMQNQQMRDTERAAREKCGSCANASKCSIKFGKGAIGCSSYRPR